MAQEKELNKEKLKALQLTLDKIERSYGKGAIMNLVMIRWKESLLFQRDQLVWMLL